MAEDEQDGQYMVVIELLFQRGQLVWIKKDDGWWPGVIIKASDIGRPEKRSVLHRWVYLFGYRKVSLIHVKHIQDFVREFSLWDQNNIKAQYKFAVHECIKELSLRIYIPIATRPYSEKIQWAHDSFYPRENIGNMCRITTNLMSRILRLRKDYIFVMKKVEKMRKFARIQKRVESIQKKSTFPKLSIAPNGEDDIMHQDHVEGLLSSDHQQCAIAADPSKTSRCDLKYFLPRGQLVWIKKNKDWWPGVIIKPADIGRTGKRYATHRWVYQFGCRKASSVNMMNMRDFVSEFSLWDKNNDKAQYKFAVHESIKELSLRIHEPMATREYNEKIQWANNYFYPCENMGNMCNITSSLMSRILRLKKDDFFMMKKVERGKKNARVQTISQSPQKLSIAPNGENNVHQDQSVERRPSDYSQQLPVETFSSRNSSYDVVLEKYLPRGQLVWFKKNDDWWPGVIVRADDIGYKEFRYILFRWVYELGIRKFSLICVKNIRDFIGDFSLWDRNNNSTLYKSAVHESIKELAMRIHKPMATRKYNEKIQWAINSFHPRENMGNMCYITSYMMSDIIRHRKDNIFMLDEPETDETCVGVQIEAESTQTKSGPSSGESSNIMPQKTTVKKPLTSVFRQQYTLEEFSKKKRLFKENLSRGHLVWAKREDRCYWPCAVLGLRDCNTHKYDTFGCCVYWFGYHQVTRILSYHIEDFVDNFVIWFLPDNNNYYYRLALYECIKEVALRIHKSMATEDYDDLIEWAGNNFIPRDSPGKMHAITPELIKRIGTLKGFHSATIEMRKLAEMTEGSDDSPNHAIKHSVFIHPSFNRRLFYDNQLSFFPENLPIGNVNCSLALVTMFRRGQLVWAKREKGWWPCAVLTEDDTAYPDMLEDSERWVYGFGDHVISKASIFFMRDFIGEFHTFFIGLHRKRFKRAVHSCIAEVALRIFEPFSNHIGPILYSWGCNSFWPRLTPENIYTISWRLATMLSDLKLYYLRLKRKSEKLLPLPPVKKTNFRIRDGAAKILRRKSASHLSVCVSCDNKKRRISCQHPLFNGVLCADCARLVLPVTKLPTGTFHKQCVICSQKVCLVYCGIQRCRRAFCRSCIECFVSLGAYREVLRSKPWMCYLCSDKASSIDSPIWKTNWEAPPPNLRVASSPPLPCSPSKKGLNVLAFNVIGKFMMEQLGFDIDDYHVLFSPEDPVSSDENKGLGCVENIFEIPSEKIKSIGPIDILIGSTLQASVAVASNNYKDLSGFHMLFHQFLRVFNDLKELAHEKNEPFNLSWIFISEVTLSTGFKEVASETLLCDPVIMKYRANQAYYVWSNFPNHKSLVEEISSKVDMSFFTPIVSAADIMEKDEKTLLEEFLPLLRDHFRCFRLRKCSVPCYEL